MAQTTFYLAIKQLLIQTKTLLNLVWQEFCISSLAYYLLLEIIMEIQTINFGTQIIEGSDIIQFPHGLLGLEDHTEFKLFHEESDNPTIHWLQSVTDADISMSIVSPTAFGIEYEITLTDDDEALLKFDDISDIQVVLVVYKQGEHENDNDFKAIVRAPLIINTKENIGLQKHLEQVAIKEAA